MNELRAHSFIDLFTYHLQKIQKFQLLKTEVKGSDIYELWV